MADEQKTELENKATAESGDSGTTGHDPQRSAFAPLLFGRPLALSPRAMGVLLAAALRPGADEAALVKALLSFGSAGNEQLPYKVSPEGAATIPVRGVLLARGWSWFMTYEDIGAAVALAVEDSNVKSVVLDIDSPGGEVEGCFDLVDKIFALRGKKPITAIVNESAYSAAYAIASAADKIYMPRTAGVGSIGVICEHWDYSELLKQAGIAVTAIFAGSHKNDFSPWEPLTDEQKGWLQKWVDASYAIFVSAAARNRGMSEEKVRATQAGIFFGQDAVGAGLADGVMPAEDALAKASGAERGKSLLEMVSEANASAAASAETARTETKAWAKDLAARCVAAKRPDLAVVLISEDVTAEKLGSRIADLLAADAGREIHSQHDPLAPEGDSPLVKEAKRVAAAATH